MNPGLMETVCLKIKDGANIVHLDEYVIVGTHWIALDALNNDISYFDSFGVEHILKEIKTFIENKNIKKIFRIQAYDSIMCGYFCIGFIAFRLAGEKLIKYIAAFNYFEKKN